MSSDIRHNYFDHVLRTGALLFLYAMRQLKGKEYVKRALEYCEKAADGWSDFGKRALENIGHGDSCTSSFGAVTYAAQQEDIYRYTVPSIIRNLSKISQELVKDQSLIDQEVIRKNK